MRVLIILVLLVVVAVGLGWIVINRSDNSIDIHVNTQEVKKDTERFVEEAKDAIKPKHENTQPAPANP